MALNFPGPYEVRLAYTTFINLLPLEHTQRLNLDLTADPLPGTAFNNINVITRGGVSTPDLAAVIEAWLTLISKRHTVSTTFGNVELWKYEPLSFEASFVSSYSPVVTNGDDGINPAIVAGQEVYTFRTVEGGILKITWIETTAGATQPLPASAAPLNAIAIFDFVVSSVNWVLARDTSYPFSELRFMGGQNEKTFRQRFR